MQNKAQGISINAMRSSDAYGFDSNDNVKNFKIMIVKYAEKLKSAIIHYNS
jgi:hypothetical protein